MRLLTSLDQREELSRAASMLQTGAASATTTHAGAMRVDEVAGEDLLVVGDPHPGTSCRVAVRTERVDPQVVVPQDVAPSGAVEVGRAHAGAAVGAGAATTAGVLVVTSEIAKKMRVAQQMRVEKREVSASTVLAITGGTTDPGVTTRMVNKMARREPTVKDSRGKVAGAVDSFVVAASVAVRTRAGKMAAGRMVTGKSRPVEMVAQILEMLPRAR